jgi:hypothetical protein
MRRLAITLAPLLLLSAPAFADPDCSKTPASMPMWQVAKGFEEAGGIIREMKITDGCYEIYGTNGAEKLEVFYDPNSGAELQRESR